MFFLILFDILEWLSVAVQYSFQVKVNNIWTVGSLELASLVSEAHSLDDVATVILDEF